MLGLIYLLLYHDCYRKVKEAWDKKKDMLISSGALVMEQLTEALTATARSNKLPDGLPQTALNLCAEQVLFGLEKSLVLCFGLMCFFWKIIESCATRWCTILWYNKMGVSLISLKLQLPCYGVPKVLHYISIHVTLS